ncbi:glutathionylspermidine synthase family protein [uncultured Desulfovibrio sp.]|uniref:glutathionylspermidine synthase family protein n=1 Tax=uncultured Desulfovibrio sp. TaxID=167968 RepID=UPI00262DDA67|nr:glutathionylspermidine synthase family protein [uncultured Desulfovibrio sp.]
MDLFCFPPFPDSLYDALGYPKEGKCSDILIISQEEADAYYAAAERCFRDVDSAAEYFIASRRLDELGIPDYAVPVIERTYREYIRHPHMLGRFDFAGGLAGLPIKLLEFNADTPFSIFEVSSLQYALARYHELDPDHFQYNSLFEQLRDFFAELLPAHAGRGVLFTNAADGEDDLNTFIIKDAAKHAGLTGTCLHWTDVCIDRDHGLCSVDKSGAYIDKIFHLMIKMVPWDLLFLEDERMARELLRSMERDPGLVVCNPPYAAVYQSKALLAHVQRLFPENPHFLPAASSPLPDVAQVAKPIWGREGRNITIWENGQAVTRTDGFYARQPLIYQQKAELVCDGTHYYQAGVFISAEVPCGLGFRRGPSPIITTDDAMIGHIVDHGDIRTRPTLRPYLLSLP